ncbi:MAG: hypothetical protein ACM3PV_10190 [Betaproteobacteria bacterium]
MRAGRPSLLRCPCRARRINWARRPTIADTPGDDLFDPAFLSELEGLVAESGMAVSAAAPGAAALTGSRETLARFFAPASPGEPPLDEPTFIGLAPAALGERCTGLLESCRHSPRREAGQAVESFVVFFQALVPTLGPEPGRGVKATFFRLVPTLVELAWDDTGAALERRQDCREALSLLETILLEVSSVRLAPAESELLFKSLDQLATLISAGEYSLARDVVAAPLLEILRKNRVARSLFRLMEVEVAIQVFLRDRLGYATPQLRLPEDATRLSEFGPIRVFDEDTGHGVRRRYLQIQLPDIPILSDIVVHLAAEDGSLQQDLRLDGLGSSPLELPPGLYRFGLLYSPEGPRRA